MEIEASYVVVLVTAANAGEAQRISRALIESKKAACVNIIPGVDSLFWWNNKPDSAYESLLVIKSKASLLEEIVDMVKGLHSYSVPEIIALPIIGGNPAYLKWLDESIS